MIKSMEGPHKDRTVSGSEWHNRLLCERKAVSGGWELAMTKLGGEIKKGGGKKQNQTHFWVFFVFFSP